MKSKATAYLLWFFLGWLSLHRFYLGKVGSGILYLLTGQLFGFGWLIDLFILGGMVDNYNTKKELGTLTAVTMATANAQANAQAKADAQAQAAA